MISGNNIADDSAIQERFEEGAKAQFNWSKWKKPKDFNHIKMLRFWDNVNIGLLGKIIDEKYFKK